MSIRTNQYGQKYKGNDDFRGWLAGGGANDAIVNSQLKLHMMSGQQYANFLLGMVGNDGRSSDKRWDQPAQMLYNHWKRQRDDGHNALVSGLQSQLAALQRQLAYQPKLPKFDVLGNYKRARSQAEAAVNPLYEKYLREFLAKQATQRQNKQTETNLRKEANALDLRQKLEQSAVDRTRTAEDTAAAIDKLNIAEGQMQQDTGTQFDRDRRSTAEALAAAGLTTSGLGQSRMFEMTEQRNISEDRQVKEFHNQKQAKELFKTRTFEDLARGDANARKISAQKDKEAQFDFDAYVRELAHEETAFRTENELKRLRDISSQTTTFERQGTQQFLASLAGAGWRPQDIALAHQVYGR